MGQIIDISKRITNELPVVRITEELTVTVNNRKNTIMSMQAMINETTKKAREGDGTFDELEMMNKSLEMLIGKKKTEEIDKLDLPFPEYKLVYQAIMAAATDSSLEEVEKRFRSDKAK